MNQTKELAAVKARIKALSLKTVDAGCSEAEAQFAMQKVGELLETYSLTMAECDLREEPCVTLTIMTKSVKDGPQSRFAKALAEFADCRVWRTKVDGIVAYCFFGLESDTQMVDYLYRTIDSALMAETGRYKTSIAHRDFVRGGKKVATCSFQRSFASTISYRLRELKEKIDADLQRAHEAAEADAQEVYDEETETTRPAIVGSALIVLKKQLVEQAFAEKDMRLRKRYNTYRPKTDYAAADRGTAAANTVNLSRPVGTSVGANKLIA